jgi:hypothetical protein
MRTRTNAEWQTLYHTRWKAPFAHPPKHVRAKLVRGCIGKAVYDSLDNRDWNLRPASNSQQMANQNRKARNTSGYIGVWYRKSRKRWCGQVTFKGKHYFTKHCKTACEAAIERNNLALEIHGEFANLNIIPSEETYHEEVQTA